MTTQEVFVCDFPNCGKTFRKPYDFNRHRRGHCRYEEREFGCPYHGCSFRANQRGGLEIHVNSIHKKIRLSCGILGCIKTFADPSSQTRHRQRVHHVGGRARGQGRGYVTATTHSSDGQPTLHHFDDLRPPASHAASLQPPSSVRRPNHTQSPHPGGFHPAVDVPPDCWSIDNNKQAIHQAYDANRRDPLAGYHVPSGSHPPQRGVVRLARTVDDGSCHRWDDSLTLAPLQGQYQEERVQAQRQSALPFSYPRKGHVSPSDQRRSLPPTTNHHLSSVVYRPNPRLLF